MGSSPGLAEQGAQGRGGGLAPHLAALGCGTLCAPLPRKQQRQVMTIHGVAGTSPRPRPAGCSWRHQVWPQQVPLHLPGRGSAWGGRPALPSSHPPSLVSASPLPTSLPPQVLQASLPTAADTNHRASRSAIEFNASYRRTTQATSPRTRASTLTTPGRASWVQTRQQLPLRVRPATSSHHMS